MPPSAETIGALAAALAKAQTEADQPGEVTATLPAGSPGEVDRTFRYAPLASGSTSYASASALSRMGRGSISKKTKKNPLQWYFFI
jgi:hypothetical protein